jgi:multidrug efflux pump subunit AcrA (membrane-fusion protein)
LLSAAPYLATIVALLFLSSGARRNAAAPAATAQTALSIPAEALLEAQGTSAHVYVIDAGGIARRRAVRFVGFDDQLARVEGLHAGERVVTMGAGFATDGARLQVVAP